MPVGLANRSEGPEMRGAVNTSDGSATRSEGLGGLANKTEGLGQLLRYKISFDLTVMKELEIFISLS